MARILYTVCGVGLGHATRSTEIIKELKKNHEVLIASYGGALEYLRERFETASELKWFELVYKEEAYKKGRTFLKMVPKIPLVAAQNFLTLVKIVRRFKPEVIVSDFDVNSVYLGDIFRIPSMTISSMHIMNEVDFDLGMKDKIAYYLTEKPVLQAFASTQYLLVPFIFKPGRPRARNAFYFDPVIREEVLKKAGASKENDFYLAYFPPEKLPAITELLEKFPFKFKVYGNGGQRKAGNIEVKEFSPQFIEDLLACKGIICHGGVSLLSEAIYLKKPACVFTDKQFFERYYNGLAVQHQGFGLVEERFSRAKLHEFFSRQQEFKKNLLKANVQPANQQIIDKIEQLVQQLKK